MTDLRQRLHDTLDDQHTDLALLATRAQTLGIHLRRRRQRNRAIGSIALATVLCVGALSATQLVSGPEQAQPDPGFADEVGSTVPVSGRSLAAAAYAALTDVADGSVDRIRGGLMSPVTDDSPEASGEVLLEHVGVSFVFTPDGASSPGEVQVDIFHLLKASAPPFETCPERAVDCGTSTLPDGSRIHTFKSDGEDTSGDPAGFETVQAMRTIGDVTVIVSAANGLHSPMLEGTSLPNQPSTVLSLAQIEEIVSQPWWGLELPAEYAEVDVPTFELLPGGAGTL